MNERALHPELFEQKMTDAGIAPVVIRSFLRKYAQLGEQTTGTIPENQLHPLTRDRVADAEQLSEYAEFGRSQLGSVAVIKLNGGLGTSMGLQLPKSLLPVRDQLNFLDIAARQVIALNAQYGTHIPFLLMNSFKTNEASLKHLARYERELAGRVRSFFLQHRFPKVLAKDLTPAQWPKQQELEWNPPGHGDIYLALAESGTLQQLLDAGYRYAFVSNIDNLGATLDPSLLGFFAKNEFSFMLEGADRTKMDRKGGHLALRASDGHLILRESAQCAPEDAEAFQDITRHHFFNTNNIWLNLKSLAELLGKDDAPMDLPLIRNKKTVDPRDASSPEVYQLETAMGSAIGVFPKAAAVRVPRSRFLPVKKSNDFLLVSSDCYRLTDDYRIEKQEELDGTTPIISLDDNFFGKYDDFRARFPKGAPSMINCSSLRVEGDVRFGAGVVAKGDVTIRNNDTDPFALADGTVLQGTMDAGS